MSELDEILARKQAVMDELTSHEPAMFKEALEALKTLQAHEALTVLQKVSANIVDTQAKMALNNVGASIAAAIGLVAIKVPTPAPTPSLTPTPIPESN